MKLKTLFKKEFEIVANKIGIGEFIHKNVNELSGGQKQRVAFAKGIIKKTNLVLMDEALFGIRMLRLKNRLLND
nr:ATP-binding cassette domain-containing protein [Mycoplasmopsis bovis]